MADRFLFKKFASETNDVGQFGSFQSTGGKVGDGVKTTDPDLIQSLPAWKAGWGNAVDNGLLLPRLEEMNGVQRVFAEMLWNQWRDGLTFWQAGAPVKALQSIVMYQTGDEKPKLYINKTGVNGTNPPPQDTDNWEPLNDSVGCGEIGDIGFAPLGIDESLNLRRYLNGQVISQSQFVSFTSKIKSAIALYPNLATTEANWQAEKTNSKLGQCGKFVVDDTAGTIRLPCVVNAQGLVDLASIGGIKSESLPNINGSVVASTSTQGILLNNLTGAFFNKTGKTKGTFNAGVAGANFIDTLGFDASRSSSTYKDNAPVQQEAVQYPYYIQVATGVEETLPAIREYNINTPFFFGQSMYSDVAPDNASWLASNGQYNAKTVYPDYYDWLVEQMNAGVSGFVASTATYTDYDFVINTTDQTFRLPLLNGEEDLPGDRYEDLTLQAGGQYTAPANGWFDLAKQCAASDQYVQIARGTSWPSNMSLATSFVSTGLQEGVMHVPVKNGDKILVRYSATGTTNYFRFIYAKGNGSLYYYIGDTVQDASLINAGAVLGQLATKTSSVEAAAASMPSGRYINLTLGASGSRYTAPANGYFSILGAHDTTPSQTNVTFLAMSCGGMNNRSTTIVTSSVGIFIPTKKGQSMFLEYKNFKMTGYNYAYFRFVYAEGEN